MARTLSREFRDQSQVRTRAQIMRGRSSNPPWLFFTEQGVIRLLRQTCACVRTARTGPATDLLAVAIEPVVHQPERRVDGSTSTAQAPLASGRKYGASSKSITRANICAMTSGYRMHRTRSLLVSRDSNCLRQQRYPRLCRPQIRHNTRTLTASVSLEPTHLTRTATVLP